MGGRVWSRGGGEDANREVKLLAFVKIKKKKMFFWGVGGKGGWGEGGGGPVGGEVRVDVNEEVIFL